MGRYKDYQIELARELRQKEKYSFAHLQRLTGIPATTIRNWCKEDYFGTRWDALLKTNERQRQELKSSELSALDGINKMIAKNAKILLAIIYGCEGAKYPSSNKLILTNSDPDLLKVFITLLRRAFVLDESKIRAHLQIHDSHNYEEVRDFWSKKLKISIEKFIKPTITKRRGGKHRKTYLGTCTVKYADYRTQLKLIGIYEAFIRKFGEVA